MTKKDRKRNISLSIDNDMRTIDKITYDASGIHVYELETGKDAVQQVDVTTSYERNNGKDKIIHYMQDVDLSSRDDFSKYHIVCACDTNTTIHGNSKYSTSAIMYGQIVSKNEGKIKREFTGHIITWESTDVSKPENYAWAVAIHKLDELLAKHEIMPNILFIVDSDLGKHDDFNSRSLPLIDNFYLPDNYTLTYASADVGAEYPANQLIRKCDSVAKQAHNEFLLTWTAVEK